jgi:hypothetical protein
MHSNNLISITCILELLETQIHFLVCPIYDISAFADDLLFLASFLGFFSGILLFGFIFAESLILFDFTFYKKTNDSPEASKPEGTLPEPPSNVPPVAEPGEDSPAEPTTNVPPVAELGEDKPLVATPAPEGPRPAEKPRGRTYYGRQAKITKTAPDVSLRKVLFPPGT